MRVMKDLTVGRTLIEIDDEEMVNAIDGGAVKLIELLARAAEQHGDLPVMDGYRSPVEIVQLREKDSDEDHMPEQWLLLC